MKIAFATSSLHGGGITSYAHEVIKAFSLGNDVSIIVGDDTINPFKKGLTKYDCELADLSTTNARRLIELINNQIKPDILINSNGKLVSLVAPYIRKETKIVSVSHSLRYSEADVAGFNNKYVNRLIALSNYAKEYLIDSYRIKDESKVSVIPNFVEPDSSSDELVTKKKSVDVLNVVYAGGTSACKTPEIICGIMDSLIKTDLDFKFYFLGADSPTFRSLQSYSSIRELYPDDSRITITGKIPRQQASEIIRNANVFLIPSRREGCPMALLEAMRSGAIVITSDYKNACREIISDGYNGFICKHDNINAFVEKIIDIINNHQSYSNIYDNSLDSYKKNYTFNQWIESMNKIVYDGTAKRSKPINFNRLRYLFDRFNLNIRLQYSKYHLLFNETIVSGFYFWKKKRI